MILDIRNCKNRGYTGKSLVVDQVEIWINIADSAICEFTRPNYDGD